MSDQIPVLCNNCNQPILAGESTYEGEKCHDSASDCVRKTREATARWCAEIAESAVGMPLHIVGCQAVAKEIRIRFKIPKETTNAK